MKIANRLGLYAGIMQNCIKNGQKPVETAVFTEISKVMDTAPHGSGFDMGISYSCEESTTDKLVFVSAFHVLDTNGFYVGWLDFTITVKASLVTESGFTMKLVGQFSKFAKYDVRDYIEETVWEWLKSEYIPAV